MVILEACAYMTPELQSLDGGVDIDSKVSEVVVEI